MACFTRATSEAACFIRAASQAACFIRALKSLAICPDAPFTRILGFVACFIRAPAARTGVFHSRGADIFWSHLSQMVVSARTIVRPTACFIRASSRENLDFARIFASVWRVSFALRSCSIRTLACFIRCRSCFIRGRLLQTTENIAVAAAFLALIISNHFLNP